jgi:hypothetical protein
MSFTHAPRVAVLSAAILASLTGSVSPGSAAPSVPAYTGSSFETVWSQVASDPYVDLPEVEVTLGSFYGFLVDHLLVASKRTLADKRDLLPYFDKVLHPNGICFAGEWVITEANPYSGYFKAGSRGLIVARVSAALSETKHGQLRAWGFAGKIFPTEDPGQVVKTANFFTIENLGGTLHDFLDAENTNDILAVAPTPNLVKYGAVAGAVTADFNLADPQLDPTLIAHRQLYPISELGETNAAAVKTPRWMMITGAPETPRVQADDFRDELRVANFLPGTLRFDIFVSDVGTRLGPRVWTKIGYIELDEDAVSESCDHRLHFTHPKYK